MNIQKGLTRIYIILSVFWFLFWLMLVFCDFPCLANILFGLFIGVLVPIITYYVILWIVKSFKG